MGRTTLWLLAMCMATPGCQLASNGVHNLAYEAKLVAEDAAENCRYQKLAAAYWQKVENCQSDKRFSKDYAKGFKDGFVDFVQYGGTGQPPDVPPKHYWGTHYRTPEGYRAIEDWYAGFRHGAAAALESGQRQFSTLPSAHTTEHPAPAPSLAPALPIIPTPSLAPTLPVVPVPPKFEPQAPKAIEPSTQASRETAEPELLAPRMLPASAHGTFAPAAQNHTLQAEKPGGALDAAEIGKSADVIPMPETPQTLIFGGSDAGQEALQPLILRATFASPSVLTSKAPTLPRASVPAGEARSVGQPPSILGNPEATAPPQPPGGRGWLAVE